MTAVHSVTVELDADGVAHWFKFACSGTFADLCHQWCAEGCEEECTADIIPWPAPTELIAAAPVEGHRWAPMPPHGESCRIVDWLDACGGEDTYGEEDEPHRAGTHRIQEEWTGDDYIWSYAEPAETDTPAAPTPPPVSEDQLVIPLAAP